MANPILLYDTITSESAKELTKEMLAIPENETIELWIDSPGGSVTSGWAIISLMQQRDVNITITGDASSMAFIMLAFARKVTAFDTTNGLLHRAASWWEEIMSEDELKDIENRNKVIRKKLEAKIDIEAFEKMTNKTFDDVFTMDDRLDVHLTASQMKKIGLIDEVVKIDVAKRAEIEANHFKQIAALAKETKFNINSNTKKMGKISDLFKSKDPVFMAEVNGSKIIYTKLEKGEFVKAEGENSEPITGSFEAKDRKITVVNNEITAVEEVDTKAAQIVALEQRLEKLEARFQENENETVEAMQKIINGQDEKISEITAVLEKAKLTASSPNLPKGEFKEDAPVEAVSAKKRFKEQLKGGK